MAVAPTTALALLREAGHVRRISTGCAVLDKALGGGVPAQGIIEVCGEAGAGKSQLCMQIALTAQQSVEDGGTGKGVLVISTEGKYPVSRLAQMARQRGLGKGALNKVFIEKASTVEEVLYIMDLLPRVSLAMKRQVGVVVVDSVAAVFRGEFGASMSELRERKDWFFRLASEMLRLHASQGVVFIVVNQMTASIKEGEASAGSGAADTRIPALGSTLILRRRVEWRPHVSAGGRAGTKWEEGDEEREEAALQHQASPDTVAYDSASQNTSTLAVTSAIVRTLEVALSAVAPATCHRFIVDVTGIRGLH